MDVVTARRKASAVVLALSLCWMTGCVGPLACGPTGSCGPLALNSCDGCGECEGCGELYIDPWINHPADTCDPCDRCGNFNGQSCGKCRSVFGGLASLWGYRCDGGYVDTGCGGCDGAGCDSCGDSGGAVYLSGTPTPAAGVVEVIPAGEAPYVPHRTRKIFRSRQSVAKVPPQATDY